MRWGRVFLLVAGLLAVIVLLRDTVAFDGLSLAACMCALAGVGFTIGGRS